MSLVTRFAPSPTGYLHVGGARTALFSWLYAKKKGGKFILRIEDTDLERSTQESVDAILEGMNWLGLDYDEGPYYQTKRFDLYKEVVAQLVADGKAYKCFCTVEEVDAMREAQAAAGEKPRYNGMWRDRTDHPTDKPFVIRFKNPQSGTVVIDDLIKGRIEIANSELDDLIIARSDGTPTYNLTVVVDDWKMGITHVIRGDDHVNNTPRQMNILAALGADIPKYAHVPMILGDDGKRLSKRHGAVGVMQYRDNGFLPEALLNYLVRLGWSHGDQEIFSKDELVQLFDLDSCNRAPSAFNTDKLIWLNQHYMKTLSPDYVAKHLAWHVADQKDMTLVIRNSIRDLKGFRISHQRCRRAGGWTRRNMHRNACLASGRAGKGMDSSPMVAGKPDSVQCISIYGLWMNPFKKALAITVKHTDNKVAPWR